MSVGLNGELSARARLLNNQQQHEALSMLKYMHDIIACDQSNTILTVYNRRHADSNTTQTQDKAHLCLAQCNGVRS